MSDKKEFNKGFIAGVYAVRTRVLALEEELTTIICEKEARL